MNAPTYDAVIAGGGPSGLSLAAHLATGGWRDRRVLIVDDPAARAAAVRWGFWSADGGLLDSAASRTYRQVRISAAGASHVVPLGRYRYRSVRRPDLCRVVSDLLDGRPAFERRPGRVESIRDRGDAAEVVVDGQPIRAGWAFDSVTAAPASTVDARLTFTGWEVRCARAVFDPDTPVLFDFRTPHADGARFVYVLPDDAHRALVEVTEFVPRRARPPTPDVRSVALEEYLRDVLHAGDYTVERTESVVLPLRAAATPRRSGRRVLAIGARGGLVKASTGYAYQRIQRDSEAIARSLARHGHPFDTPSPRRRHRLLDAVLLRVLDLEPARLEQTFARLFSANPAERVLRFLDEDTGIREELRLIACLPPAPYLRAVAAGLLRRTG